MTTYRMRSLSTEQLRSIASEAVADVARQKITTTKGDAHISPVIRRAVREGKVQTVHKAAVGILNSPTSSGIQKRLASSVLSQAEGRGYFKDAFNKARKG